MNRPKIILTASIATLLAILLAWQMSGFIRENLILPSLEFSWLVQNYYRMIPQEWLWSILIVISLVIALRGLAAWQSAQPIGWRKSIPSQTPARELAFWLARIHSGPYQRWLVAQQLAHLARDVLRQKGARVERGMPLTGPGWNPPEDFQKYLQAAMFSSPQTFGPAIRAAGLKTDPEIKDILEYLESYAEAPNEY